MSKFLNISTDNTLGGSNASDEKVASQKAVKDYVGNQGYITGITSSDVTTALGYTPYSSSNPSGYTSNVGTVTSVNNTQPDANGNVSIAGLTVDQTYNSTSTNAQSGTAVAGAISTKADDSAVGKLASDNTWTGDNKISSSDKPIINLQNTSITKGTTPSAFKGFNINFYDGQGTANANRIGLIECGYKTDGTIYNNLYAYKPTSGSTTNAYLGVCYPASGSPYAIAPAPTEDTTSSIQIDTVGARNTKLQSYALDSDVVKLTGDQIIDGVKTFRSEERLASGFSVYDTRVTKGTNPSSTVYKSIFTINDSTYSGGGTWKSMRLAVCELSIDTAGKTDFYFGPYKNEANSTASSLIHCIYDKANNIGYATCPASAIVNSIVTTAGISKASTGYVKLGNGIIIQWGEVSSWDSNVATATFPIAFSSRPFGFTLTRRTGASTTNDGGDYYARNVSTTSMSIYRTSSNTGTLSWTAIGY